MGIANNHREMADEAIAQVPDYLMTLPMFGQSPPLVGLMVHLADYLDYWWGPEELAKRRYPNGPTPPTETSIHHHYLKDVRKHWDHGWKSFVEALRVIDEQELRADVRRGDETLPLTAVIERTLIHVGFVVGQIVLLSSIRSDSKWNHESA